MGEGLKIVNEVFKRAKAQHQVPEDAYLGINVAVLVLSDPANDDLWKRMVGYCNVASTLAERVTRKVTRKVPCPCACHLSKWNKGSAPT